MSFKLMRLSIELFLCLHFYIRLRVAYGGGWWQAPLLFWLALMFAPMFLQKLDLVPQPIMSILLYIWPLWIGFLLFFLMTCLTLDFTKVSIGLIGKMSGKSWWKILAVKRAVSIALVAAFLIFAYSYYTAHNPRLTTVQFKTDKLPEGVDVIRVVQMTDVHLSRYVTNKYLKRMTYLASAAKPDILVITGDLVDTDMSERDNDAALLAGLKPRYGSFAVLGNHELYAGEENSLKFYEKAGLKLLRGESQIAGGIVVAGIDDEIFGDAKNKQPASILLNSVKDKGFVLFLKHRPKLAPATAGLFDLQLSGHTHGGQIWPGYFFVKAVHKMVYGLYPVDEKSAIFISRGAGFWGMPLRFLAPPEVVLIEIVRK